MKETSLLAYWAARSSETALLDGLIRNCTLVSDNFYQYSFASDNLGSVHFNPAYNPTQEGSAVLMPRGAVSMVASSVGVIENKMPLFPLIDKNLSIAPQDCDELKMNLLIRSGSYLFYCPYELLNDRKTLSEILKNYYKAKLFEEISHALEYNLGVFTEVNTETYLESLEQLAEKKTLDETEEFFSSFLKGKFNEQELFADSKVIPNDLIENIKKCHDDYKRAINEIQEIIESTDFISKTEKLMVTHRINFGWINNERLEKIKRPTTSLVWSVLLCCLDLAIYNTIDSLDENNELIPSDNIDWGMIIKLGAYVLCTAYYLNGWYTKAQTQKYTEKAIGMSSENVGEDLKEIEQEGKLIFMQVLLIAALAGLIMGPLKDMVAKDHATSITTWSSSSVGLALVLPLCAGIFQYGRARAKDDKSTITGKQLICMFLIGGVAGAIFNANHTWLFPALSDSMGSTQTAETVVTNLNRLVVVMAGFGLWKNMEQNNAAHRPALAPT